MDSVQRDENSCGGHWAASSLLVGSKRSPSRPRKALFQTQEKPGFPLMCCCLMEERHCFRRKTSLPFLDVLLPQGRKALFQTQEKPAFPLTCCCAHRSIALCRLGLEWEQMTFASSGSNCGVGV